MYLPKIILYHHDEVHQTHDMQIRSLIPMQNKRLVMLCLVRVNIPVILCLSINRLSANFHVRVLVPTNVMLPVKLVNQHVMLHMLLKRLNAISYLHSKKQRVMSLLQPKKQLVSLKYLLMRRSVFLIVHVFLLLDQMVQDGRK